jgi:hypothetical protein
MINQKTDRRKIFRNIAPITLTFIILSCNTTLKNILTHKLPNTHVFELPSSHTPIIVSKSQFLNELENF